MRVELRTYQHEDDPQILKRSNFNRLAVSEYDGFADFLLIEECRDDGAWRNVCIIAKSELRAALAACDETRGI